MRQRLTEAAARLIAGGGAATLSTRRIATEAGTSTMAVYTHFGSMEALVDAVVEEGFARLEQSLVAIEASDDPVRDLGQQTLAYVGNGRENPELYAVMFGAASLGTLRPMTPERLAVGRGETLDRIGASLARAVAAGRIRDAGGFAQSFRWWTLCHGYVMLEGAGYLEQDRGTTRVLLPLLLDFLVGEGDDRDAAKASLRALA